MTAKTGPSNAFGAIYSQQNSINLHKETYKAGFSNTCDKVAHISKNQLPQLSTPKQLPQIPCTPSSKLVAQKAESQNKLVLPQPLSKSLPPLPNKANETLKIGQMNEEDQNELKRSLNSYVNNSAKLAIAKDKLQEVEKKICDSANQKSQIANNSKILDTKLQAIKENKAACLGRQEALENEIADLSAKEKELIQLKENEQKKIKRDAVKFFLCRILKTDASSLCSLIPQSDLDKIDCNLKEKFLITNETGMECVIIKYLKTNKQLQTLDLTCFKHGINETALIKLFQSIQSTSVESIIISRPLTATEISAKDNIAKSGRQFTLTIKLP